MWSSSCAPTLLGRLAHSYGTHAVLRGATFSIDHGEKIGFVGRNGSGKTTLLRAMLGTLKADQGSVQMARGARMGYLSQDPNFDTEETVRDAAEGAFAELHTLHLQLNKVYEDMAGADGNDLDRLLKRQADLESKLEAAGGYAIDHRIDAMLHALGFSDEQFALQIKNLSGGQKGRLGLARLLLEEPDLLLLDEPTNHLDINGRQWLEAFLADEYPGAVLVVSHDRWLLDRVVSRIIEVEMGVIREYPGNYHKYVDLRKERQLTQARVYDKQLDRIRSEEQFIRKFKAGQRAKQARGRETRLERFKQDQLVERPIELDVMRLTLPKAPRSGDIVLTAESLTKRYDDLTLFEDIDLSIARGDRIGIIGPNGVGKSTLVRCLLEEEEPTSGSVRHGSRLSVGYYRQTHEHLDFSLTIWQYLQSVIVSLDGAARATEQQARDLAGAFLFSGGEQDKTLTDVSGGERSRAVIAGLVAGAHNLLVLDEPTNHLDIPSAERLEQALSSDGGYDGTLLLISHDRALLQATCDRLIVFDGEGDVSVHEGDYRSFERRQRDIKSQRETQAAATAEAARAAQKPSTKPKSATKPSQKPSAGGAGRPHSQLSMSKLELQIEQVESRIAEIDASMLDPAVYSDGDRCKQLQTERKELAEQLTPLEKEWMWRAEG